MEREVNYEVANGQLMSQKQIVPENEPTGREIDREKELADVVYVFTAPDKPGIRFYDRTPSGAEAQMTGVLPDGKFITDMDSISKAEWDEALNKANTVSRVMTRNGEVVVKTIMVSEEQLDKIMSEIIRQKEGKRVVIDTVDRRLENRIDYEQLVQLKNNLISGTQQFDNVDPNKNDLTDGTGSFTR